jgi:DNA-binding response OmpR family regulator
MSIVLIVEDEQDVAIVLAKRLKDEGFEVIMAQDAYEGFSLALKDKPDLVLLDLMLPAGGGLQVLQNIRNSSKIMNMPVVVITGIKDVEYEKKVLKAGVEAYLEKPYDFEKLKGIIQKILKSPEA